MAIYNSTQNRTQQHRLFIQTCNYLVSCSSVSEPLSSVLAITSFDLFSEQDGNKKTNDHLTSNAEDAAYFPYRRDLDLGDCVDCFETRN